MKRARIQVEEEVYELLRHRAFREKKSIARVVREIVKADLSRNDRRSPLSAEHFAFIGAGRSKQGSRKPVPERHDEALGEAFQK